MTNILSTTTFSSITFAGIDVGAEELVLVLRMNGVSAKAQSFANTRPGHQQLLKTLAKCGQVRLCLEATGVYYVDLAVCLHDAGVAVSVVNPKAAHNFAKALMRNNKTDAVDADVLAQFAERMDFVPWTRPSREALALRAFARRIDALTRERAAAKNQLHALCACQDTPKAVVQDAKLGIAQLQKRIERLDGEARALIRQYPQLERGFQLLLSIKGVGQTSAIALLGELIVLPKGLTHKQWVKYAGLNPRIFQSGKSVEKKPRLSKEGNCRVRQSLYMPALSAKRHDPYVKAYFEHLLARGKKKLQALCAVMRKLLHAIHGMLKHQQPFDNTRFYAMPKLKPIT
jgi:transposase